MNLNFYLKKVKIFIPTSTLPFMVEKLKVKITPGLWHFKKSPH